MLFLILSALLAANGVASSEITSEVVTQMIDRYGAKRTVDKLAEQHPADTKTDFGKYDLVLDGVSSGDPRWLVLVPKLEPGEAAG